MSRINPTESESRWALDYTMREEVRLLREQIAKIHDDRGKSIELVTASMTRQRLESERLLGVMIRKLREDNADLLEQVCAMHSKYLTKDCTGCDGVGAVSVVVDETPRGSSLDPVEHYGLEVCEDCRGTKREWI